jgi:hypothetical protein
MLIALSIILASCSGTSLQQPTVPPTVPPPPQTPHCTPSSPQYFANCTLIDTEYDVWVTTPEILADTRERKVGNWKFAGPCDCALKPVGEEKKCDPDQYSFTEQREVCWTFSVTATGTLKTGLIIKILGDAGLEVEIGGSREGCKLFSTTQTFSIPVTQCFTLFARDVWVKRTIEARGIAASAESKWTCTTLTGTEISVKTHCGTYPATGSITFFGEQGVERSWTPEICGGATPPPDWDGRFDEPCCHPICEEVPPGEAPCCDLIGSN